jgi:Ca2+-binding EF-hand superfamily protein
LAPQLWKDDAKGPFFAFLCCILRETLHRPVAFDKLARKTSTCTFYIEIKKEKKMASNQVDSQASTNYKEAFALFDKRGNGRCTIDSLGDLLRACGQNPTLAEIQELEKGLGNECEFGQEEQPGMGIKCAFTLTCKSPCAVDFDAFQRVLNRPGGFRDPGEPEEYCRGFQVFDKDMTGFIGVGQLKYILTNLGEKMTEEEVDELLKAVDTSSGQINYTGMCASGLYWPTRHIPLLTFRF